MRFRGKGGDPPPHSLLEERRIDGIKGGRERMAFPPESFVAKMASRWISGSMDPAG